MKAKRNDAQTMRQLINGFTVAPERDINKHKFVLPYGYLRVSDDNPVTLNENINEGLVMTYPIDSTIRYIKDFFNLNDLDVKKVVLSNNIEGIHIIVGDIGKNIEVVTNAMSSCGYHFSRVYSEFLDPHNGINFLTLEYLPKIQEDDVSEEIRKTEPFLYHITPTCYEKKIIKIGFTPKTKNAISGYPDRVYLLRGSVGQEFVKNLGLSLYLTNNSLGKENRYTVFVLDTNKVCDKVSFFKDPQSTNGLWTYHNIPPEVINTVKHLDFDKNNEVTLT